MRRKTVIAGIGTALLLLTTVGVALALLVGHEKAFYRRGAVPPGPLRQQFSLAFMSECNNVINNVNNRESKWYAQFTDAQINSFFEEQFIASKTYQAFLPEGVSSPRIAFEPGKIRLGFRYGSGTWSTIVSIDLRVWLAKKQANVICLELQGLHAGSLPISAQSLLENISETCRRKNIDVKWYRYNGNPVARLRFQNDSKQPTVQLSELELRHGLLVIGCRSTQASPTTGALASNQPGELNPATE
jgi:hypothetical protein